MSNNDLSEESLDGGKVLRQVPSSAKLLEAVRELDALCEQSRNPWELMQALSGCTTGRLDLEENKNLNGTLIRGLAFTFTDDEKHYGALELGKRFSSPNGDWPAALDTVDQSTKYVWLEVAQCAKHPMVRTHFLDLAISSGVTRGIEGPAELVSLYQALAADENLEEHFRATALCRAWSLARKYHIPVEAEIREELFDGLQSGNFRHWGSVIRVLRALVGTPKTATGSKPTNQEILAIVNSLSNASSSSINAQDELLELREKLASNDVERCAARTIYVESLMRLAEAQTGMLRALQLHEAARKATGFGLTELRDQIISNIQASPIPDQVFTSTTEEFVVPNGVLDARLGQYRRVTNIYAAIQMWMTSKAPTGCHEDNQSTAKEIASRGLTPHVSRLAVNEYGLLAARSDGPKSYEVETRILVERMTASYQSIILSRELDSFRTEFQIPSPEALGRHLANVYNCDVTLSLKLAVGLNSYWDERPTDAAQTAYSLIEASLRGILLLLGCPIYRVPAGSSEGRFPSLETYLERLAEFGFDPDWGRTLGNPVATLRNAMAHGHQLEASKSEAALLLRAAGLLVSLTPESARSVELESLQASLRNPLSISSVDMEMIDDWRLVWVKTQSIETDD